MRPRVLSKLAAFLLLLGCAQPPDAEPPATAQSVPEPPGRPSRRLSTCIFQIAFATGSSGVSPIGQRVIAEAAEEARSNGSRGAISVFPVRSLREGESLAQARGTAVVAGLIQATPEGRPVTISRLPLNYLPQDDPSVYLRVCDLPRAEFLETLQVPPRDRALRFDLGGVQIAVPLMHFDRALWLDTPLEVRPATSVEMFLSWPALEPVPGPMQRNQVSLTLLAPTRVRLDSFQGIAARLGHRVMPLEGRLSGLRFFAVTPPRGDQPGRPITNAHFVGQLTDRSALAGGCHWTPLSGQLEFPTAAEIGAALRTGGQERRAGCGFDAVRGPGHLWIAIGFGADLLADWEAIHRRLLEYAERFMVREEDARSPAAIGADRR